MASELLPCAFCGSMASFHQVNEPDSDNDGGYYVECGNPLCGMTTALMFACGDDPKPQLVERWNKRVQASDDGISRVVVMLREPPKEFIGWLRGEIFHMWVEGSVPLRGILAAIASYIDTHARQAPSDDTPSPAPYASARAIMDYCMTRPANQWSIDKIAEMIGGER